MPDVIIVTETLLTDAISDCELLPSGYHTFRRDHGLRGGGVLVAVSFCLTSFLLFKPHLSETLVVKILSSSIIVLLLLDTSTLHVLLVSGTHYLLSICPFLLL